MPNWNSLPCCEGLTISERSQKYNPKNVVSLQLAVSKMLMANYVISCSNNYYINVKKIRG